MPEPPEQHEQIDQQPQLEEQTPYEVTVWSTVALYIPWALLFWLVGPVLFPALLIQRWAATPLWDAEERWASIKRSAFLPLLSYLPVMIFHQPLTSLWSHIPTLGEFSILPPTFDNMLFRWVIALPLIHLLAWMSEVIAPKTIWYPQRVLLPAEQGMVARAKLKDSNKTSCRTSQQRSSRTSSPEKRTDTASERISKTPSRHSQGRHSPAQQQSNPRKKRDTRTLWQQMPDDHPWKQDAIREAMRQTDSQRSSAPENKTDASSQQAGYNWDDGEGTLKI